MLYTRKGDDGTTKVFDTQSGERISKSSSVIEALGSLDEINSFLGLVKVKAHKEKLHFSCLNNSTKKKTTIFVSDLLSEIQNNLFIIQAIIAGAKKKMRKDSLIKIEEITDCITEQLPPIKTFLISGGMELSALFDIVRTLVRKSERRVVTCYGERKEKSDTNIIPYLNRLSSLFFVLARYINFVKKERENAPRYNE